MIRVSMNYGTKGTEGLDRLSTDRFARILSAGALLLGELRREPKPGDQRYRQRSRTQTPLLSTTKHQGLKRRPSAIPAPDHQCPEEMFAKEYPGKPLRLDDELIKAAAQVFSLRPAIARRMIQAASAFDHFKLDFEDKIAAVGNTLTDEDQYFFDQILQSKHARTEFEFDKDALKLSDDAAETLFQWAFSKLRKGNNNENMFKKAEDIRAWQALSKYDSDNSTNFAAQLDVENPSDTPTIKSLVNQRGQHEEQMSPLQTLASLAETFEKLPAVNLVTQAEMLEPILTQVRDSANRFLEMIKGGDGAAKAA